MKFVANGHVRITGARLAQLIEAPNAAKARNMAEDWASENDLVFDGIETPQERRERTRVYSVRLEAFGKVRIANVEADSPEEALTKVKAQVGYVARVTAQPTLDRTHTGAVTA